MSSDLKDARWGLAMEMAKEDGRDWYAIDYAGKEGYLRYAQSQLELYPSDIVYWAEEFRKHD